MKSGEIQLSDDRTGEEEFESWVKSLSEEKGDWANLKNVFDVCVRLIGYTDQWNADFKISPAAISELAARGLPLKVEPFLSLDVPDTKESYYVL